MNLENKSFDPAVRKMLVKAKQEGIETVWDRFESQQPQCGFGLLGTCCRNCLQGPCRIDPFGEGPQKGACGAKADLIVARNLLRSVVGGTAAHADHAYEAAEALYLATGGQAPYEIKDEAKLKSVAAKLGLAMEGKDRNQLAREVAETALADFANHTAAPMKWLTATAPQERVETWSKLGVLPRNPDREIRAAMHQTSMGVDSDPVNLILSTVKLGLVDGYGGLHMATDIQDILFGTPAPVVSEANLGVLKEDQVNIVVHGHVPLLSEKVVEWARKLADEAVAAGAKGIQLSGICCTGNEVLMRQGIPLANNFLAQELAITTGVVDAMVIDVQCIMPALADVASCYHTRLITTMPVARMPGAQHVPFEIEKADETARQIVRIAIEAYKNRDAQKILIPQEKSKVIAGFSVEAIISALAKVDAANPLKPLVDNIINGNILGACAVVGCNNAKVAQDSSHVALVRELLRNNVLVVATGCAAHALGKIGFLTTEAAEKYAGDTLKAVLTAVGQAAGLNAPLPPVLHLGSCVDNSRIGDLVAALAGYLKVAIKDLPVAASAPEYQHEKAVAIGTWAISLGVFTHLGVVPPVLGSVPIATVLTEAAETLLGGKFYVEADPVKAAAGIIAHLKAKRAKLGI